MHTEQNYMSVFHRSRYFRGLGTWWAQNNLLLVSDSTSTVASTLEVHFNNFKQTHHLSAIFVWVADVTS
jgi:hypothetical protein